MDSSYKISLKTTLQYIKSDIARYRVTEKRSNMANLVLSPGLLAGIYYRFGHWIYYADNPFKPFLTFLRPVYLIGKRFIEIYTGISVSPRAKIGSGLYFNHFGTIFIGNSIIGENCNFGHETTLGVAGRGNNRGLPMLGNRVFVGAGAKILGPIHIGDDVAIGANAVVTKDLQDRAVAVGIPAKVVSYEGSFDFVLYDTMEHDTQRLQSLQSLNAH